MTLGRLVPICLWVGYISTSPSLIPRLLNLLIISTESNAGRGCGIRRDGFALKFGVSPNRRLLRLHPIRAPRPSPSSFALQFYIVKDLHCS